MSFGMNAAFMRDPESFMRTYPIEIDGLGELGGADNDISSPLEFRSGVHYFDLEPSDKGSIFLRQFDKRLKKDKTIMSNRIHAYWLPWRSEAHALIQLGREADYFFTSALAGCRIQIGDGANPLVMHIDGYLPQHTREEIAAINMPRYVRSRRFSSTQEYPRTGLAFLVGKAYGHLWQRRWRFFAQGIDYNEDGKMIVGSLKFPHGRTVVEV